MKNLNFGFLNNGTVHFTKYLVLLLVLPALFCQIEAKASICCVGGNGEKCWGNGKKKKSLQMKRTFSTAGRTVNLSGTAEQPFGLAQVNPPVLTYSDMAYAYSPQNGLQYYAQTYGTGSMDLGTVNLVTPQQWVMPNCTFDEIDTARGIPVAQTPYLQDFPTASHCKLYEYPEDGEIYSYYEYYDLNQNGITLLGSVDDFNITPNVDETNLFIAPLPIDINFHLVVNDTIFSGTRSKILIEDIAAEGFGTLATPWGVLEVIKIVNHYNEFYYKNGVLIDEYHQPVVTFISKTGNQLDITVPEGYSATGLVPTECIEFTRIVYDSFATMQNLSLGLGTNKCYDAFQTITVAGNGTTFTVNNGAAATMVSGHNINYQAGTKVKYGGYMHGYITTNGKYCTIPGNPEIGNPDTGDDNIISESDGAQNESVHVYPNPTSGAITLQLPLKIETGMIRAEITDINGIVEISENLAGVRKYNLSVESLRPGMYFLHVTTGESKETIKLIRL